MDISGIFILAEFGGILRLVESSGFLRYGVDISRSFILVDVGRNLIFIEFSEIPRLVESGGFPRFLFRVRAVYYKIFLLIIGGGK